MAYFVCPRCHLSMRPRRRKPARLRTYCPRCLGRRRERILMFPSSLAYEQLAATQPSAPKAP